MERLLYLIKKVIPRPVFSLFQPAYHWLLALFGAVICGFPSRSLTVIGVTGTNGKSTVVEILHELFSEAGYKTASLSSVRFKIGAQEIENTFKMTMPGRFFAQKFLRDAKKTGATHVILEVTSEGIKQSRHKYIKFAAAVLTNLTPEHIESHGGFGNYKKAKGELFKTLSGQGVAIVNLNDANAEYFLSFSAKRRIGYTLESGIRNQESGMTKIVAPANYEMSRDGIKLYFADGWEVSAPLNGRFNAENMLAAIAVAEAFSIPRETLRRAFANFRGVPGRMEEIQAEPFRVIVDYAFTPNALRQVYETLAGREQGARSNSENSLSARLICVLGAAGGGRDKWKRPELGKIAGKYCTEIIVTNEDPYDEDPRLIIEAVAAGAREKSQNVEIIEDRRAAIRAAVSRASVGDTVIITGKGCESSIVIGGGRKIPWDDRATVREELKKLGKNLD